MSNSDRPIHACRILGRGDADVMAAAAQAFGVDARSLPASDERSMGRTIFRVIAASALLVSPLGYFLIVPLGVWSMTAARSLFGRTVTIGKERGRPLELPGGGEAWITVHPSYLLRLPDPAMAEVEFGRFVEDLKLAHRTLEGVVGEAK